MYLFDSFCVKCPISLVKFATSTLYVFCATNLSHEFWLQKPYLKLTWIRRRIRKGWHHRMDLLSPYFTHCEPCGDIISCPCYPVVTSEHLNQRLASPWEISLKLKSIPESHCSSPNQFPHCDFLRSVYLRKNSIPTGGSCWMNPLLTSTSRRAEG